MNIEPICDVRLLSAVMCCCLSGGGKLASFSRDVDPVPLALERIGWQSYPVPLFPRVETAPVYFHSRQPQVCYRCQKENIVRFRLMLRFQRGYNHSTFRIPIAPEIDRGAESAVPSDLQQNRILHLQYGVEALIKTSRLMALSAPVPWVRCLFGRNPLGAYV